MMRNSDAYKRMGQALILVGLIMFVVKVAAAAVFLWMLYATIWACVVGNWWGVLYAAVAVFCLWVMRARVRVVSR